MMLLVVLVLVAWVGGSLLLAPVVGRVLARSAPERLAGLAPQRDLVTSGHGRQQQR
jgi:hypothetical protein